MWNVHFLPESEISQARRWTVQNYWYLCEAYRDEEGHPRERVLQYLGVNPNIRTFPLEEPVARRIAPIVASLRSLTKIMNLLKDQGFAVSFRPRQVQLINNPPSGVFLFVSSEPGPFGPFRNGPKEKECPTCHRPLTVCDTWTHDVWFLAGKRTVTEVTLSCRLHHRRVFYPSRLTPTKSPFAFDLVAEAGCLRFLEQRQFAKIATALHERGPPLLQEAHRPAPDRPLPPLPHCGPLGEPPPPPRGTAETRRVRAGP